MDNGCIFLFLRGLLTSLSEEIAESSSYCHQENNHTSNKPSHYGIIAGSFWSHFCTTFRTKPVCLMNKSTAFWTSYLFHIIL